MSTAQVSLATASAGTSEAAGQLNRLDALPDEGLLASAAGTRGKSVGGVATSGASSRIETITGVSYSTGQRLQGELIFGRTSTGSPMFWLKGTDTNYVLRGSDGKLLTNAPDARKRAQQLISGGGAVRLRNVDTLPGATEVRGPTSADNKIRINLEDPAINPQGGTGRAGFAFGTGEKGSALTSTVAVENARNLGVPVAVVNDNPKLGERSARMRAVVEFSDDAAGGRMYARVTAHPGGLVAPTYQVPPQTSAAFKKGYAEETWGIASAQVQAGAQNIAAGMAGAGKAGNGVNMTPRRTTVTQVRPKTAPFVAQTRPVVAAASPVVTPVVTPSPKRSLNSAAASPKVRQNVAPTSVAGKKRADDARAVRQAQGGGTPAIKGKIAVREGINLGNLGEFKLQTLPSLARKHGIPEGELRVMVFVRHGESMANKTDTFAGNVPGIRTPNGWVRTQNDAFTSLPNGEVMAPGGQIPLSKLGQQQARDAAPLINQLRQTYDIRNATVSPVLRAQQTYQLATGGQPRFANEKTTLDLAERGMGAYIGTDKKVHSGNTLSNANVRLDGRGGGYVGGRKTAGDTAVTPNAEGGRSRANRPVEDRTGFEDWTTFNGRIRSAANNTVLPDVINGGSLQVTHQYSIASQLKRIDPRIDTAKLGHGIPNGQPLVVIMRVQSRGTGEPKLTVVDAGYYRGNGSAPAAKQP